MSKLRILHLEDDRADALLVRRALEQDGLDVDITVAPTRAEAIATLERGEVDAVLADSGLPGLPADVLLPLLRERCPHVPIIIVSGTADKRQVEASLAAGAVDYVTKDRLWQLSLALRRAERFVETDWRGSALERHNRAMMRLVTAVQALSLARDLDSIMAVVRTAARNLSGADGATFVLRDGDRCHYADEDAISPLWKGQRFPMSACISGWAMLNRQTAAIEDIYADSRIPADAYRPTFVKSLVMVPIRTEAPIGAIGTYWAKHHLASPAEVELLQALANTTSVAMESVQLYQELEQRVRDRTAALEAANRELEAFSYSVSHDLRAPLRSIDGFSQALLEDCDAQLDHRGKDHLRRVRAATQRLEELIDDLLGLARVAQAELRREPVDLTALARSVVAELREREPQRGVEFRCGEEAVVQADPRLVRIVLTNLLGNAWKFTARQDRPTVEFGTSEEDGGRRVYFVRDNGAGFDMAYAGKLFGAFQRLHTTADFPGSGIGLATVQRIVHRHDGRVWAEGAVGQGATFYFTLESG
jgi:signal transduction histidine kinase/DNA-binding NarL/FixJ family response regulator